MSRKSARDKTPRIARPWADYGEIVGGERFDAGSYPFGFDAFIWEERLSGIELMFVNRWVDLLLGFSTSHVWLGSPSHAANQKTATRPLLKVIVTEPSAVVARKLARQWRCAQGLKSDRVDVVGKGGGKLWGSPACCQVDEFAQKGS